MKADNYILQLKTAPASEVFELAGGLTRFKKELIKVGRFVQRHTGTKFEVTKDMLTHWVRTFDLWLSNGNKVSVPASHLSVGDAKSNQGWVTAMSVEGDSLYGIIELKDPELALTSDVSICFAMNRDFMDSKGIKYKVPITHVALCSDPIIPGLESFEKLEFSYGDSKMKFMDKIYKMLSLSGDKANEDGAVAAITALIPENAVAPAADLDPLAKLLSDNRVLKLSGLLKAGLITADIKDIIEAKYVKPKMCVLELSQKSNSDAFDFLFDVLSKNKPVELGEQTSVQSLELSNVQNGKENPVEANIKKRREAAGLKD